MKMKKIVSFFLTALLTMSMAACGTNTEKAPTKTESTPAAQEEHKEDAKEVSADVTKSQLRTYRILIPKFSA